MLIGPLDPIAAEVYFTGIPKKAWDAAAFFPPLCSALLDCLLSQSQPLKQGFRERTKAKLHSGLLGAVAARLLFQKRWFWSTSARDLGQRGRTDILSDQSSLSML